MHAVTEAFSNDDIIAVLLVDASNAFNSLNRDAALHNIQHLCSALSSILINIYHESTELFVDGIVLYSEKGTTQEDPLAMLMYALATIPLINLLGESSDVIQVWMMPLLQEAFPLSDLGGTTSPLLVPHLDISPMPPKPG